MFCPVPVFANSVALVRSLSKKSIGHWLPRNDNRDAPLGNMEKGMKINMGVGYGHLIVFLELDAFAEYRVRLEEIIKYLHDQEPLRTSHTLRRLQDLTDKTIEEHALREMRDSIIPRFFRNPAVVSLYAIFEAAVTEIAPDPKELENIKIRGKRASLLKRAKKYFNDTVKISFCSDTRSYHQLEMLEVLRHAVAHCNGRLDKVKPKDREKIRSWMTPEIGVEEGGNFLISDVFLKDTYRVVKDTIYGLVSQVNGLTNELGCMPKQI